MLNVNQITRAEDANIRHRSPTKALQNQEVVHRHLQPIVDRFWYKPDDLISFTNDDLKLTSGSYLILANDIDITQMGSIEERGEIVYSVKRIQLKRGLNSIEIYTGSPIEGWTLHKTYQIGILDDYGFERSKFQASLSLDSTAQPYFNSSGSTLPPPNPKTFYDLDYKTGFILEAERSGWTFSATQDWVGTSRETKALRFSELGDQAPLFDLSGYNFTLKGASTTIEVGNNSGIGSNPLLVERIANRGITITQDLGSIASIGLTAQSGRLITGYDEFLGIGQKFNSLYGAEVAIHPFEQREHLQIAFSWLDSEQPAQADFGFGQVAVAEASQGWGLNMTSKTFNGRVSAGIQFASSTYSAPNQQEVDEFGSQNIFLNTQTNQALQGFVSIDLVASDSPYATTLSAKTGRYDPQYRVISGFSGADQLFWDVSLNGKLNSLVYSVSGGSSRDNLDNVPFILTTRTDNLNLTLGIPLQDLISGSTEKRSSYNWVPSLNYTYSYLGQLGINDPLQDPDSLFNNVSQIPEQYNHISNFDLGWNFGNTTVNLGYGYTYQNNEQPGRQREDNYINSWNLAVSWKPSEFTTITPRISYVTDKSRLTDLEQRNLQHGLDLTHQINPRVALSAGYAYGSLTTSSGLSSNSNSTLYGQVSYSFLSPFGLTYQTPGSLFLRLNYTTMSQEDSIAGVKSSGSNFWVNAGFSLKLF